MPAKTRDQINFAIHRQMELHFGERSCEASHKWLNENFGISHVADLTPQQAEKALGRLRATPLKVRDKIWDMISPRPKMAIPRPAPPPIATMEQKEFAKRLLIEAAYPQGYSALDPIVKTENPDALWISLTPFGQNMATLIPQCQSLNNKSHFNMTIHVIKLAIGLPLPKFITECQYRHSLKQRLKHLDYEQLDGSERIAFEQQAILRLSTVLYNALDIPSRRGIIPHGLKQTNKHGDQQHE
jgi:hypothetical protein